MMEATPMRRWLAAATLSLAAAAATGRPLPFAGDQGAHPDSALEWWYWTGHLRDTDGREYGFQLTFFRVAELGLAHFAWTDRSRGRFEFDEKAHLSLPGIASAETGKLDLANEDWSAREVNGRHRLHAGRAGLEIELDLRPQKPAVLHGDGGISRKGPGPSDYSRYVSITRLGVMGRFRREKAWKDVTGTAWFDHEWGPGGLPEGLRGWDWFAVQLSDGSELMLYRLRGSDGAATPFSSGTVVPANGPAVPIRWKDVALRQTRTWTSPRSRAVYPARWELEVAGEDLRLAIEPVLADQELVTSRSTGVTYWEGACRVSGTRRARAVSGQAYVELTGYAGRDVPGFASAPRPDYSAGVGVGRRLYLPLPFSWVSSETRKVFASLRWR